jgi:hypothetical protein
MKYSLILLLGLISSVAFGQSTDIANTFECQSGDVELEIVVERNGLTQNVTVFDLKINGAMVPVTRTEIQHTAVGTLYSAMESRVVNFTKTHALLIPGAFVTSGDPDGLISVGHYMESTAKRLNLPNKPFLTAQNQSFAMQCRLTKS